MKKKCLSGKCFLALFLALILAMGNTGGVSAVTVSDNTIEPETAVSVNSAEDVQPETAYDGTPSKVIGLNCKTSSYYSLELEWNALSTEEKYLTPDGKPIYIGYQVEENGKITDGYYRSFDGKYEFRTSEYYYSNEKIAPGVQFKYRVRGLYYVINETATQNQINVIAVGEWSDYYNYTVPTVKAVPVASGLKIEVSEVSDGSQSIRFSWNPVSQSDNYEIQYMYSDTKLTGLTKSTWDEFYNKKGSTYEAFKTANPNAYWQKSSTISYSAPWCSLGYINSYKYYYARVRTVAQADGYEFYSDYSEIASFDATQLLKEETSVEQVKNFRVEYDSSQEKMTLAWTPIMDENLRMAIFAYEKPTFPQYYYYNILNARGKINGSTSDSANYDFSDYMDSALKKTIDKKVIKISVNPRSGKYSLNGYGFDPEKTYYFVAHTYDYSKSYEDRNPIFTIDGIRFVRYADVSAPSTIVSAKKKLGKPEVYTESAKTAITLYMNEDLSANVGYYAPQYRNAGHTGYEIYRKSGKKYKKIATTTDSFYKDSSLKKSSKYQYKVRAYYYDKDTKKTVYSDYAYVTGETGESKAIDLVVKHKSQKKVSLKWTKVKGAVKYEIYRTSDDDGNPREYAKANSADKSVSSAALKEKYTLIKTIKKAGTTSYVDKNLTPGTYYNYVVVAYYKVGKTMYQVADSASVRMMLSTPSVKTGINGTTAKFSWDKNSYAAGYEVEYTVYNKNRYVSGATKTVKTAQNSFSVSVPQGGYVTASVRAYSASQCYSEWSSENYIFCGLPVTSGIKAKAVTVKNSSGQAKNAVQISWNPVAGAKYYKVYRSTKMGVYVKDTNSYAVDDYLTPYIAKESNDDELYNEASYEQYYGEIGSVIGTTAYDYAQLDAGVKYYYYVVAFGEKGTYVYSLVHHQSSSYGSGKPAGFTAKVTMKINKITNKKKGQAVLTWSKVSGGKKYYVYRSNKKKGGYKLIATTKKNSYTDKKVKKGKTYYYKIVAKGTNPLKADYSVTSPIKKMKIKK